MTQKKIRVDDINATGTPSDSTYLRGDNTWYTPSGSGDFVPYTGATQDVNLGTYSLIANTAVISSSGEDLGELNASLIVYNNIDDLENKFLVTGYLPEDNTNVYAVVRNMDFGDIILDTSYFFIGNMAITGSLSSVTANIEETASANIFSGNYMYGNNFCGGNFWQKLGSASDFKDFSPANAGRSIDNYGDYLFVGTYQDVLQNTATVIIYNIEDRTTPVRVSPENISGLPQGTVGCKCVKYFDGFVYASYDGGSTNSLRILDVSDVSNPVVVAGSALDLGSPSGGSTVDIDETNKILYFASSDAVFSIDISNPSSPSILDSFNSFPLGFTIWTCKYSNGYVYVAGRAVEGETTTLHILNVSDPENIIEVTPTTPIVLHGTWSLIVEDNYVYMANGQSFIDDSYNKFAIVDISDKVNPEIVSELFISSSPSSYLRKSENIVYLTNWATGSSAYNPNVFAINVENPENPYIVGAIDVGYMPLSLYPVDGGVYLYLLFAPFSRELPFFGLLESKGIFAHHAEIDNGMFKFLQVINTGYSIDSPEDLNASILVYRNIDDVENRSVFNLYMPSDDNFLWVGYKDGIFDLNTNFNFYGDLTVSRDSTFLGKMSANYSKTTGTGNYTVIENSFSVNTAETSGYTTFGTMHNVLIVDSDYNDGNVHLDNKVFGNQLQRRGTLSTYGISCDEINRCQRNWTDNLAIFNGTNNYGIRNECNAFVLRDEIQWNSNGYTVTVNSRALDIDVKSTAVETAGIYNGTTVGIRIESVNTSTASITNGKMDTYGIHIMSVLGHASGETYSIKDDSTENWIMTGTLYSNNIGLPITGSYYFGDESTNDSWRLTVNNGDFETQKRVAGEWIKQGSMGGGAWGEITGDVEDQTDLINYLEDTYLTADGTSGGDTFGMQDGTWVALDYIASSEKGANNGVATLNGSGKVPAEQIDISAMEYKGLWNANTNTPTISDVTGTVGDTYIVSVGGTRDLGSGNITFSVGAWVLHNGVKWETVSSASDVVSVNSKTGVVVLKTVDIEEDTKLYYTEERVSANSDVSANTSARHTAVTLAGENYLTLSTQQITASKIALASQVSGILPLANGGTAANLTASNGGIVYSGASALAILSGTDLAGRIMRSGANTAPSWSTATYPATTTQNRILYSSSNNVIGEITSANTGALVTNSSGAPSFVSGTTANRILRTNGTAISFAQVALSTDVSGQLPMANGGTGANLSSPGADRLMFWDQSATAVTWLTPGTGLTITDTTINVNQVGTSDQIIFSVQQAKIGHLASPAQIEGGMNRWYLLFDAATDEMADFQFVMPRTYSTSHTISVKLNFSMDLATGGNVVWAVQFLAISPNDTTSTESTTFAIARTDVEAVPVVAGRLDQAEITFTSAQANNVSAGDLVVMRVYRDADNGSDTAPGDARLAGIILEWQ